MYNYVPDKSKIKTLKDLAIYNQYLSDKISDWGYEYFEELDIIVQQEISNSVVYIFSENEFNIFVVKFSGSVFKHVISWDYPEYINTIGDKIRKFLKIKCKLRSTTSN